jgi:hypothetical protein
MTTLTIPTTQTCAEAPSQGARSGEYPCEDAENIDHSLARFEGLYTSHSLRVDRDDDDTAREAGRKAMLKHMNMMY